MFETFAPNPLLLCSGCYQQIHSSTQDENRKLAATNDDLRGKMTILTDKLITLKSTATSLEHILEQEKQSSKAKLEKLTTKLADAKTKLSEAAAKEGDYLRIIQVLSV